MYRKARGASTTKYMQICQHFFLTYAFINPASFNFPTNSSTPSTFCPASLTGGSSTLNIWCVGFISTPQSLGFLAVKGFFLAFWSVMSRYVNKCQPHIKIQCPIQDPFSDQGLSASLLTGFFDTEVPTLRVISHPTMKVNSEVLMKTNSPSFNHILGCGSRGEQLH